MAKYSDTYFDREITTVPGSDNILQTHSQMEQELGERLPESFPLSLWMVDWPMKKGFLTFLTEGPRQELIIPENPQEQAIYWLEFKSAFSRKLNDSLLVRITDRPQCILGILDHPQIDDIVRELRSAYDSREIRKVKKILKVPTRREWWEGSPASFDVKPHAVRFYVIYPQNGVDIARDFEDILKRYSAIDPIYEKGFEYAFEQTEVEIGLRNLLI